MTQWTPEELAGWWRLAAEYSEGRVRRLIEAVRDPDRARQLTTLLQDTCDEIRYGDSGARLDFAPIAACVALGEVGFEEAIPVLFDVGGFEAAPPLDTAATWALQRLGAPAFRRVISLIGDPFERSFGYTMLEGRVRRVRRVAGARMMTSDQEKEPEPSCAAECG